MRLLHPQPGGVGPLLLLRELAAVLGVRLQRQVVDLSVGQVTEVDGGDGLTLLPPVRLPAMHPVHKHTAAGDRDRRQVVDGGAVLLDDRVDLLRLRTWVEVHHDPDGVHGQVDDGLVGGHQAAPAVVPESSATMLVTGTSK